MILHHKKTLWETDQLAIPIGNMYISMKLNKLKIILSI